MDIFEQVPFLKFFTIPFLFNLVFHFSINSRPYLTFGTRILHLNFSTFCMENVNNTGTKKGSIMK